MLQLNHYIYIFASFATYVVNMVMPSKVTINIYTLTLTCVSKYQYRTFFIQFFFYYNYYFGFCKLSKDAHLKELDKQTTEES